MSERKRDYPSGAEKRKSKRKREEVIKKVPKISSFFHRQDTVSDLDWKDSSEARSSSNIHSEIEESQAHTSSDVHPEIEEHQVNDSDIFEDCNIISSDRGNFGDNLSECERKIIFKLGPFKPQGPFPKDSESNRPFSAYYYSYFNQAGIKLVRPWLCYSNVLNKPYCHFCWLLADRQNKSYSSAWVNGVSVRSNFTQTILDHEKSQQHMNASLSYNNWLQGNTIDTLLQSEINSKITFWRDVLHRIINVIITLASCNLSLRGHDSDSGNFMAILRLLSNYDATLKELLLKPKVEINYLSPTIQNEIISLLGTTVRNNIISEIKKAPFLTIILDTTQDLSKIDQLSVVFRYISVTENDDNVPKEIKICESFLGFIAVTDCSAAGLKTAFLNLTKEYGIDLTKCRGQGYDGANVMSGIYGGLQTLIEEHAPNADYVHCAAHALNLVLNDAARHVREISTFFDNLEKVYTFFGNSIKRWAMLSDDPSEKYLITLKKVCPTRWSSRNDALLAVKKNFLLIMKTLYQLNLISNKKDEREECKNIINILESYDFLVLVTFFSSLFEIINPISKALQHENNDLQKSSILLSNLLNRLCQLRNQISFNSLLNESKDLAKEWGVTTVFKNSRRKITKRFFDELSQDERISDPESYFKVNVYYCCLDILISQTKERFQSLCDLSSMFEILQPEKLLSSSNEEILIASGKLSVKYSKDISVNLCDQLKALKTCLKSEIQKIYSIKELIELLLVKFNSLLVFPR
ncbi:unnamed protein product [Acanthoscelides obtectus]|uniref:DUF4371 domain-containing protein n=1 Tax=Acanthoscelides obtectus TaxID=200917 RepID=A0A9P0PIZ9_ACAOB|nr:unnamed protein product [Acanthoscelides obtectus]CAK1626471.1 Zinc finger MYM-type protein 1 [Acanthoscelides obtectus]